MSVATHKREYKLYGINLKNYSINSKKQKEQQIVTTKNSEKRFVILYSSKHPVFSKIYKTYKVT